MVFRHKLFCNRRCRVGDPHRLTATLMPWPAERVSRGWISEGTSHPKGPHDHANDEMKKQNSTMTPIATLFGSLDAFAK
jgi:hypothetical protein